MAVKWWTDPRSLLAARVRSFRKRLRASYVAARQNAALKAEADAVGRWASRMRELESNERRVNGLLLALNGVEAYRADYNMTHTLRCEVNLSRELLMRLDLHDIQAEIAIQIGRAVTQTISELNIHSARLSAGITMPHVQPLTLRASARGARW